MIIPLILYSVFVLAYATFLATLVWHLKEYTLAGDPYRKITVVFLTVIILFLILSALFFFAVPWTEILNV